MKLTVNSKVMKGILESLQKKGLDPDPDDYIQKAFGHKYLQKIPKRTGPGFYYIYQETFQKPINALKTIFGYKEEKISEDYEKNNIKKDFGADKKTFAAHILEYFANKIKWDNFFSKKENREKTAKPVKMNIVKQTSNEKLGVESGGQGELTFEKKPKISDNKPTLNRSLMRKVYNIYNEPGEKENEREERKDNPESGSGKLSDGTPARNMML